MMSNIPAMERGVSGTSILTPFFARAVRMYFDIGDDIWFARMTAISAIAGVQNVALMESAFRAYWLL